MGGDPFGKYSIDLNKSSTLVQFRLQISNASLHLISEDNPILYTQTHTLTNQSKKTFYVRDC